jgi:hypothetical protein
LYFAFKYVRAIPATGHDAWFVIILATVGAALGLACGLLTNVYPGKNRAVMAKATASAATIWIVGMGSRVAFGLFATHGGESAIGQFSYTYQITSPNTWADALLLMALAEVLGRTAVLAARGWRLSKLPLLNIRPDTVAPTSHKR